MDGWGMVEVSEQGFISMSRSGIEKIESIEGGE